MNRLMFLKTRLLFILVVLALATTAWAQQTPFRNGIKQGQIKVKFTPEMTTTLNQVRVNARTSGFTTGIQSVDAAAKATGASNMYRLFPYDAKFEHKLRRHGLHLWYVVEIKEDTNPITAVAQFKQLREVAVAEVEHEKVEAPHNIVPYTPGASPMDAMPFNDPLLRDQWHYNNTGQLGVGDADINLFEAWKVNTGANDVIVSIHDQGVDVNHIDLKANIWVNTAEKNGQAGVDDDLNGYVDDINGYNFQRNKGAVDAENHGTHVAGTIAAVNNNNIGVSGIAGGNGSGNGVKVMSLQILGGAPIERSYVYAANNGAVISQNSWGYSSPGFYDQSILDAIDYFVAEAGDYEGSPMRGGLVLFASGNSDWDAEWYPGYYPSALSVSAIGAEWRKASYSNYGAWVEISAPGGDQGAPYGSRGGVLSTIPKDQYAYMQGTSMACPHMSGIAALALANRTHQLTNTELWNKLVTGVVNIDKHNADYIGKLGSGAADASLAIKNDQGKTPAAIVDLTATDIAQEFAKFKWTVPADEDDGQPLKFSLYYHTQAISIENLSSATKVIVENDSLAGKFLTYEVGGLLGLTHYYVAITSTDRWGNTSVLSDPVEITTNDGPSISVNPSTLGTSGSPWTIDASTSTTGTTNLTILNNAAGLLRYSYFTRHKTLISLTTVGDEVIYPVAPASAHAKAAVGRTGFVNEDIKKLYSAAPTPMAFTTQTKSYTDYAQYLIGETDTSIPNAAASRFFVNESEGFNLTHVSVTLKLTKAATGASPIVVEIYKGATPEKANLVLAQPYTTSATYQFTPLITLNEQLYFEQGSTFWVVFHVPSGNLFPLGVGWETSPEFSSNCFISLNVGATWQPLEEAMNDKNYAWTINAQSQSANVGTYLSLEPGAGDVSGLSQHDVTVTADASTLVNGTYSANIVLSSNDAANRELRVPVFLKVQNHQPNVKMADIADYGSVFIGAKKTFDIILDNQGYGRIASMTAAGSYVISGAGVSQFVIEGSKPSNIPARDQTFVRVSYVPTTVGTSNATLTITGKSGNNVTYTYNISLYGVGAETSKILISPEAQVKTPVAIGDQVSAEVTVQNVGAYPLKYFIPGFDTKSVSENWPSPYHQYGYKMRTNYASESNPIPYQFQDIQSTGVDITRQLLTDENYVAIDMGFDFPYYDKVMKTIYVAQKGFTTFDNEVRPINTPGLNNSWGPRGYISLLGTYLSYSSHGQIFYQKEADRLIIQFDHVTDDFSGDITAQMVLFYNGDIRFYYHNMGWSSSNQKYLNVLIEDYDRHDGILVNNYNKPVDLSSGTALGFDYPGPNIISSVVNGSGILAPGASSTVTVNLNTANLTEGTTNRYINFISNDPKNPQKSALVQLDIVSGGTSGAAISTDTIAFGNVFQGAIRSQMFTIKNNGTANAKITSMAFGNSAFNLSGEAAPFSVKPGLYNNFTVTIPTGTIASLSDKLTITYSDNSTAVITVTGNVVAAPAIAVDLSAVNESLAYKATKSIPFSIQNTGASNLEVSVTGEQWATFDASDARLTTTYAWAKHNTGGVYQWIDIRKTGVHIDYGDGDIFDPAVYWQEIDLPFPFEYYGNVYSKIKLGLNGIASFSESPEVMIFSDNIPSTQYPGTYIMPYWTFGGFDSQSFPAEDVGIFYQAYDDKVIITWSYLVNNFGGMGDPISAQMFLYKNGTMKFQYKVEAGFGGGDQTSGFTFIGLQKSSTEGVMISPKVSLDYGTSTGLAYIVVPDNKMSIAPGATLSGDINLNSFNVYGGTYNSSLKIKSNVPNQELLEKPVTMTVAGVPTYIAPASIDFGNNMVNNPSFVEKEFYIENNGSAPLDITMMKMKLNNQNLGVMIWAYVSDWFGNYSWQWTDIGNVYGSTSDWPNPVTQVPANERMQFKAYYSPTKAATNLDSLFITTNIGMKKIELKATAYRAPGLAIDTTPVNESVNTLAEVIERKIAFSTTNTNNGQGDLKYTVDIEFGRAASTAASSEKMATTNVATASLISVKATPGATTLSAADYNRVITHTDKTMAEHWVGTGGSSPFAVATKYNAGAEGFSLSHVETFFRAETLTTGKIMVEIRAGGTSISNASKLAEGSFTFTTSGDGNSGSWIIVPLDNVARLYPNEDFYVIVTCPLGIEYPQGVIDDETTEGDRYFYYSVDESAWYDINDLDNFATTGWLMFAGEKTAGVTSWLTVTSLLEGEIAPGAKDTVRLSLDSHYAFRGDQIADIVFTSNDPAKKVSRIPVKLHVNEAPHFTQKDVVFMNEKEIVTVNIPVTDAENNNFTVSASQTYAGVTHTFENGMLSVILSPDYGAAGSYDYTYTAKDDHDATSEFVLHVEVSHTNRAPEFIGSALLHLEPNGEFVEYSIEDFYADPDDDNITYTISSADKALVDVFVSGDAFLIKPTNAGETTLTFTVTDAHGAVTTNDVAVKMNVILATEQGQRYQGLNVYPNPVEDKLALAFSNEWSGEIFLEIVDATGRKQLVNTFDTKRAGSVELNVSVLRRGVYILRATAADKQTTLKLIKK